MPVINDGYFLAVDEFTPLGKASGVVFDASGYDRSYTRYFRVRTQQRPVGPFFIANACPTLPIPFAPYLRSDGLEYDPNALAVRISVDSDTESGDTWDQFIVKVDYSTKMPDGGPVGWTTPFSTPANTPWLRKPKFKWENENVVIAAYKDLDGKPYLNSAKMFFKPAPTVNRSRAVLTLTRFERRIDADIICKYVNALNVYPFMGRPAKAVQLIVLQADQDFFGPVEFYKVTYRLRFARKLDDGTFESLQPEFWDAGTHRLQLNALVPFASLPVPIYRMGHPITDPVLLDGSGQELKPHPTTGAFNFNNSKIQFREYPLEDFNALLTTGLGP